MTLSRTIGRMLRTPRGRFMLGMPIVLIIAVILQIATAWGWV